MGQLVWVIITKLHDKTHEGLHRRICGFISSSILFLECHVLVFEFNYAKNKTLNINHPGNANENPN